MSPVDQVEAVPGQGIAGDRYFQEPGLMPDQELTLIESEQIAHFNRETGSAFTGADIRRNIVTRNIRLNDLVDREFRVGDVRARGIRLCEPCRYIGERLSGELTPVEVVKQFTHRAGLRAQILSRGMIQIGDPVLELPE